MPDPVPAPPRGGEHASDAPSAATEARRPARPYRIPPFLRATLAIHAGGLATLLAAPGRWPWVAGALVLDHLVVGGACLTPQSRLLGPNLSRLGEDARARGEVGLTFDDGPDPEVTPRVLDLLAERGAQASFFAIGRRVREHPEIAAEIARRGHRVENHTLHHRYDFSLRGVRPLEREIAGAQEAIAGATGRAPAWFRAPAGLRGPFLEPVLARQGLRLAAWTRRGYDTVTSDLRRVLARLLRNLSAGDVLLLHDGSAARAAGRPVVLEVLPRLLDALAASGLRAVPLPDDGPPPAGESA